MRNVAILIGRFCPPHFGHTKVIDQMIGDVGAENCLVVLGSSNTPISFRVLFEYGDRRRWLKRLYPEIRIVGQPDMPGNDNMWFGMLGDIIQAVFGYREKINIIIYGGSNGDINYSPNSLGIERKIIDRGTLLISGSLLRDKLLRGESIDDYVDGRIVREVLDIFQRNLKKIDSLT